MRKIIKVVTKPDDNKYDGYIAVKHPKGGWLSHPYGRKYENYINFTSYPSKEEALLAAGADPNKTIAPNVYAKLLSDEN